MGSGVSQAEGRKKFLEGKSVLDPPIESNQEQPVKKVKKNRKLYSLFIIVVDDEGQEKRPMRHDVEASTLYSFLKKLGRKLDLVLIRKSTETYAEERAPKGFRVMKEKNKTFEILCLISYFDKDFEEYVVLDTLKQLDSKAKILIELMEDPATDWRG